MTKKQNAILEKSIKTYGVEKTLLVCIEEMSELIQAITKIERYPGDQKRYENVIEEIADVSICIEYLRKIYYISDNQIKKEINKKIRRQEMRMEGII